MEIIRAFSNLMDGEIGEATVTRKDVDGVQALYVDAVASKALDADFGVGVDMAIPAQSWTANFRRCEYWCRPAFGTTLDTVPERTQGFIYRLADGRFGVILPVVSEQYKAELVGNEDGTLGLRLFSWYDQLTECHALAAMAAVGDNPYALLKQCAATALSLLGTGVKTRAERTYPAIMEYLGWCSWDAMQIRVCEEKLLEKCEEFKERSIPVKWAILDDMWGHVEDFYGKEYTDFGGMLQVMHDARLTSFAADPLRFPHGLDGCIDRMKAYGLTIGMWHPTTGYWRGMDKDGAGVKAVGEDAFITAASGHYIHSWERDKAYRFYDTYHRYLRSCGADFVKVDNQSMTRRFYKGLAPVGEVARSFHAAIEDSVKQHFSGAMINCMGTASEDMWNRTDSPISRCSGDFMPEDAAWFRTHITQCAYNGLIQGQFYYCDWDMWWTDDAQAVNNSILRAVSGGPIYVSDKLGRSRREVLMPLVLEDGRILRCDGTGVPTADCLTTDARVDGRAFKIWNRCGDAGVVAAFNLDESGNAVTGTVSPRDIDGLVGDSFAVYEHFSRELVILGADESLAVELKDINDARVYVIVPIVDGFAAIGRVDKFISPKTVAAVDGRRVTLVEDGVYATVEDGVLCLHDSREGK